MNFKAAITETYAWIPWNSQSTLWDPCTRQISVKFYIGNF